MATPAKLEFKPEVTSVEPDEHSLMWKDTFAQGGLYQIGAHAHSQSIKEQVTPLTVGREGLPRSATVNRPFAAPVIEPGKLTAPAQGFYGPARSQVIAEWHGQVQAIHDEFFVAELRGTLGGGVAGSHEEAQIPMDEVREEDVELVREGAFFRLCVNLEVVNGTKRRVTDLVFRRMPAYRRDELEEAVAKASTLFHAFRVE